VGKHLNIYWHQKRLMAGVTAEPPQVTALMSQLQSLCHGWSLGGAGGGGFILLITKEPATKIASQVKKQIDDFNQAYFHKRASEKRALKQQMLQNSQSEDTQNLKRTRSEQDELDAEEEEEDDEDDERNKNRNHLQLWDASVDDDGLRVEY
jgi:galactokinase/mevalonate kinase-like predicted kinase